MKAFSKNVSVIFRYNQPSHINAVILTSGNPAEFYKKIYSTLQNSWIPSPASLKKLQELFHLKKSTACNILRDHKKLAELTPTDIDKSFNLCSEAGINKEILEKNIEVLTTPKLDEKIKYLKKLPYSLNATVPFLSLSEGLLEKFVEQELYQKRIDFFAQLFEIQTDQACSLLKKRPFLLSIDLAHIEKCYNTLIKYGITKEEICRDLWVFKYAEQNVVAKLQFASNNNIKNIKTWMIRAPIHVFENCIRRTSDNQLILGEKSFVEFLSQRLQCSQELVKHIIFKHPAIENKRLKKINEMIDFLMCNGFKPYHICRTPKILLHSVDTIRARLKLIQEEGKQLNSLSICTKSNKQFMNYLNLKPDKIK